MTTAYHPITVIRSIERDLTSGKLKSLSPEELHSLEEKIKDANSQVSGMSNAQLYFSQLADERQQIKDTYQAKKEKLNTPEERDELLSQHRSALATNQYLMGIAKSVQGKSFSDILSVESANLNLKSKKSLALLSMLEAKADKDFILDAKGQLKTLTDSGLDTGSCHSFENAIAYIKENGAVESNIKYRTSLEDVYANIMKRLNDIGATPSISYENLEVSLVGLLAPEDHPYEYVKAVCEGLAAGEFSAFTPAKLRELEDKLKQAYSLLPEEDQYAVRDDCYQMMIGLDDLQTEAKSADTAEAGIENILDDYFVDSKRNPQAWKGFKPGEYKVVQKKQVVQKNHEEGSAEEGVQKLIDEYNPKNWGDYSGQNVVSPTNSRSFTAYCVTEPKHGVHPGAPKYKKLDVKGHDDAPEIEAHEIDFAELGLETSKYIPLATLEQIIKKPKPFKSRMLGAIAKAALVVGGVAAAFLGYDAMKMTADAPIEYYHGTPAVEVIAPKIKVEEPRVKTPEVSEVRKSALPRTKVRGLNRHFLNPALRDIKGTESHSHVVLKGDTIVGLWETAYQGNLAFDQYLREVKSLNRQLKNPDKIWPGQTLIIPSGK